RRQNMIMYSIIGPYIRFKPDINVKFVYYYAESDEDFSGGARVSTFHAPKDKDKTPKERAKEAAKQFGINFENVLSEEEVSELYDVSLEGYSDFFVLHYQGDREVVRTFNDMMFWPSEDEMAAAFKQ